MATGSVGNIAVTKRSKALITGSATNDVAYTCPAGSYSDVYLDGFSTTATSGGASTTCAINLFIALDNKTRVIPIAASSGFSQSFSIFAQGVIYSGGGYTFIDNVAFYGGIGNRLTDGTNIPQEYDYQSNPTLPGPHREGTVFRLFPGDYIALTYTGTTAGVTFNITTLEVTSSV